MIVWQPSVEIVQSVTAGELSAFKGVVSGSAPYPTFSFEEASAATEVYKNQSLTVSLIDTVLNDEAARFVWKRNNSQLDGATYGAYHSVSASTSSGRELPQLGLGLDDYQFIQIWHSNLSSDVIPQYYKVYAMAAAIGAAEWQQAIATVSSWENLGNDWDGDLGIAPSIQDIRSAQDFLVRAQSYSAPAPEPYIAGDGEIGLRWCQDGRFTSVSFLDGGRMLGFATRDGDEPLRIDEQYSAALNLSTFFDVLRAQ